MNENTKINISTDYTQFSSKSQQIRSSVLLL